LEPRRTEEKERGAGAMFEVTIAENFTKPIKEPATNVRSNINPKQDKSKKITACYVIVNG
jgi:hypothetical protein